jgi:hypothetical protein
VRTEPWLPKNRASLAARARLGVELGAQAG